MQQHFADGFWYYSTISGPQPDIALFRLYDDIVFNPNIQPIRLPSRKFADFTYEGWAATIMGFGLDNSGVGARFLQYGHYIFLRNDACNFVDFEICAVANPNQDISTQGGDSGKLNP